MLSCGVGLAVSAGSEDKKRKLKVGATEFASMVRELEACPVQNCGDILCFRSVGAVARDDWSAVADAVSVTEAGAKGTKVGNRLEEA